MKLKILRNNHKTLPFRVRIPARFSDTGKVHIKYFRNKTAAEDFVKQWSAEREQFGSAQITSEERALVSSARAQLGDLSLLPEVIAHWKKTGTGAIYKRTVAQAAEEYIAWAESQAKTYGPRTLSDIRWRMKAYINFDPDTLLHQIGQKEIQRFLDTHNEGWSRKSFYKRLRPFFRWARAQRIIAINPMDEMQPPGVSYHAPDIYTVEELEQILHYVESNQYVDIIPFICLSAFGFVRTSELVRMYKQEEVLRWENIHWNEGHIHVPHGVAKRTRRALGDERFIPINDSLRHWLGPYKKEGTVVPFQHNRFYRRLAEVLDASGVDAVDNGFRHSCLSYWISAHPDIGLDSAGRYAGNSPTIMKRHYLKTLKPSEAVRWWQLRRVMPLQSSPEQ